MKRLWSSSLRKISITFFLYLHINLFGFLLMHCLGVLSFPEDRSGFMDQWRQLPSLRMPTRKHFFSRQYWHWFLWCWSIWHSLFDLRRNTEGPKSEWTFFNHHGLQCLHMFSFLILERSFSGDFWRKFVESFHILISMKAYNFFKNTLMKIWLLSLLKLKKTTQLDQTLVFNTQGDFI